MFYCCREELITNKVTKIQTGLCSSAANNQTKLKKLTCEQLKLFLNQEFLESPLLKNFCFKPLQKAEERKARIFPCNLYQHRNSDFLSE